MGGAIAPDPRLGVRSEIREVQFLPVLLLAMAGFAVIWKATSLGVGLGSDSVAYIAAARSSLAGYGLSWLSGGMEPIPMTLHAPLYPLVLAGLQLLGTDPLQGMRVVNAVSFALEIGLVGLLLRRITGSPWFALLGAFTAMSTGELIAVHSWGMSDPLYLALAFLAITLLDLFFASRGSLLFLGVAVSAGLACLTRYVGVSLVAACSAFLMVDPRLKGGKRLHHVLLFLIVSVGPLGAWWVRNLLLTGLGAGRMLGWNPEAGQAVARAALPIILNWFLPSKMVEWLVGHAWALVTVGLIGLAAMALLLRSRLLQAMSPDGNRGGRGGGATLVALFVASHLAFLVLTSLVLRPGSDVDERILSPAYVGLLILVIYALSRAWRLRIWAIRLTIILLCALLVRNKVVYAYWVVHGLQQDGQRYASTAWRSSPTIAALKEMEPPLIYTDDIAAVYLLADRYSYNIPRRLDAVTGEYLESYPADLATMRYRIGQEGAILVLFDPQGIPADMAPLEDLTVGLCPLQTLSDGVIHAACPSGSGE